MKTNYICLLALGTALSAFAAPLEYWTFDDASGTDLNDLANSGSLNSSWNFNTAGHETNGSGQFVISGDTGTFTRKLPDGLNEDAGTNNEYATPFTTGKYLLEVTFDSWNMDAASVGDTWKLGVNDLNTGSTTIAQVIFEVDSATSTRVRWATSTLTGGKFREANFGLTESSQQKFGVEFDFDNDTVRYLLNDVEQYAFSGADAFNGSQMGQLLYVTSGDGTDDWVTSASSLTLEGMGVTVIPEPSTLLLLCTALGGLLFFRRWK